MKERELTKRKQAMASPFREVDESDEWWRDVMCDVSPQSLESAALNALNHPTLSPFHPFPLHLPCPFTQSNSALTLCMMQRDGCV